MSEIIDLLRDIFSELRDGLSALESLNTKLDLVIAKLGDTLK